MTRNAAYVLIGLLVVLLLAGGWAMVAPVVAHEARPAYLEMRQADAERAMQVLRDLAANAE